MNTINRSLQARLRVIWAITSKDLLDAIKNKTTLAVFLPVLFILAFYGYLPQISGHDDQITVYLHDPTKSAAQLLENSLDLDLREVASVQEMMQGVANSDVAELGISLPVGYNPGETSKLHLEAYTIYWLSEADRLAAASMVEQEFSYLLQRPVEVDTTGNLVYHSVNSDGLGFLASMSIVFALVMIGISFLPNLMLEEYKEQTIKLLQVSPASASDLFFAKALTGLFYALLMCGTAWILYRRVFINPVMITGVFLVGSVLFVSAGLLLGSFVKTRQQLLMIGWVIILPLMLPPFLEMMDDILPQTFIGVIRIIPSVSLARMLRSGFTIEPDWAYYLGQFAYLVTLVAILIGLNIWNIRRQDR